MAPPGYRSRTPAAVRVTLLPCTTGLELAASDPACGTEPPTNDSDQLVSVALAPPWIVSVHVPRASRPLNADVRVLGATTACPAPSGAVRSKLTALPAVDPLMVNVATRP